MTQLLDARRIEFNVIITDVVNGLNLQTVGEITVKGIIGKSVTVDLVRLPVQVSDDNVEYVLAVCSEMN